MERSQTGLITSTWKAALTALLISLGLLSGPTLRADDDLVFHTGTNLISLEGHFETGGLSPERFGDQIRKNCTIEVADSERNSVSRPIVFAGPRRLPLDLTVALEWNGEMINWADLGIVGFLEAASHLNEGDSIRVTTFSSDVRGSTRRKLTATDLQDLKALFSNTDVQKNIRDATNFAKAYEEAIETIVSTHAQRPSKGQKSFGKLGALKGKGTDIYEKADDLGGLKTRAILALRSLLDDFSIRFNPSFRPWFDSVRSRGGGTWDQADADRDLGSSDVQVAIDEAILELSKQDAKEHLRSLILSSSNSDLHVHAGGTPANISLQADPNVASLSRQKVSASFLEFAVDALNGSDTSPMKRTALALRKIAELTGGIVIPRAQEFDWNSLIRSGVERASNAMEIDFEMAGEPDAHAHGARLNCVGWQPKGVLQGGF